MKRRLFILIPCVILGSLITWRIVQNRADGLRQAAQQSQRIGAAPMVSVASARVTDIAHAFEAGGTVEAPLNVDIAPKVMGRIDFLQVREGDRVGKGQVLVRIDPSEIEAQVQQQRSAVAEAEYRLAQAEINQSPANVAVSTQVRQQKASVASAAADYNQVVENYKAQLASADADVKDAEARVRNAEAAVRSAEANLANAKIKHDRIYDLYKQGFTAAQDVDDAKAALSVQEAALDVARGQLASAEAQKDAAEQQASIVRNKGLADIAAAKAKADQAQAALEYAEANTVQASAYKQSLAALSASADAARASLRSTQAKRADTVLKSPLDGFVTGRYMDPGAIATPGQPIISVQFIKQIWITISVPEEIVPKIHIGQPARVTVDALPGRRFMGSVIQVNPAADPQSRQFMVRVIMSNAEGVFKPGMFAHVSIETDRVRNALVVPREAVQHDGSGDYVMLVDSSGKARRQSVVKGIENEESVAIMSGLSEGDTVITMSAFPVRDGQPVRAGDSGESGRSGRRHGAGR